VFRPDSHKKQQSERRKTEKGVAASSQSGEGRPSLPCTKRENKGGPKKKEAARPGMS